MSLRRRLRKTPVMLAAVLMAAGLLSVVASTEPAQAQVSAADFKAGNLISDAEFYKGNAMTAASVQTFLNSKGAKCKATSVPCLKDYTTETPATPQEAGLCEAMTATSSSTAAQIIERVGRACGINQQVLLVMIHKESGIVATTAPTGSMYQATAGFACPDSTGCDAKYYGFFNQVYRMARQFKVYTQNPTRFGYIAKRNNTILYNPNPSCGSSTVYIENQATANLYIYTPYQPNQAALKNMYGTGDSCSAYGNRNFWREFNDWFGGEPAIDPQGAVDSITAGSAGAANVHGWAWDGSSPLGTVMVRITSDGKTLATVPANYPKPELANYGIPGNHAFAATVYPPRNGANEICATAVNIGGGKDVAIGCKQVTVSYPRIDPAGDVETATRNPDTSVTSVKGYAYDMSTPNDPIVVILTVNGSIAQYLYANEPKPALAYYGVPGEHGFTGTVKAARGDTVCAYAVNTLGGYDQQISCEKVVNGPSPHPPISALAASTNGMGGISVNGWAYDATAPTSPVVVVITTDGGNHIYHYASGPRPELANYGIPGNHGFSFSYPASKDGPQQVCMYAVDIGPGDWTSTGCKTVNVTGNNPQGAMSVSRNGSSISVNGYAFDANNLYAQTSVMITRNGNVVAYAAANAPYPGLANYGVPGNHGFSTSFGAESGKNNICLFVTNIGPGSSALVQCTDV